MKKVVRNISKLLVLMVVLLSISACGQQTVFHEETHTEAIQTEVASTEAQTEAIPSDLIDEIAKYKVVYPKQDKNAKVLAQWLANKVADEFGITLAVESDAKGADGKEILIGTTNRVDCPHTSEVLESGTYLIGADENHICVRGGEAIGDYYAVSHLISTLLERPAAIVSTVEKIGEPDTRTAMSFNIYVGKQTEQRRMSVLQTILRYLPDTVGVQEASPEWMDYLKENLGELYGFVGTGREGGEKGEHCAILYRKDRFELVETDTKWLSDTPDEVSKYEESSYIRIFTYAVLTDRETGGKLVAVNTHLDNGSSGAREKQLAVLLKHLERFSDKPIILTGDFNQERGRGVYNSVTEVFTDSCEIALESIDKYTHLGNYEVIDYVFVSSQISEVPDYRVIDDLENGMVPSDHFPVLIEYKINSELRN